MKALQRALPLAALVLIGASSLARAEDPKPLPKDEETPWFNLNSWHGGVELGINGSEGNTRSFNGRAGANGTRETDLYLTKIELTYKLARTGSATTENKAALDERNDWKLEKGSRWSVFEQGRLEFDDFQDWDMRLSLFGGVGYRLVDEAKTKVNLRAGLGVTKKFGGSDTDWRPGAILGADAFHQLTERQKLTASIDFYPAFDPLGRYTAVAKAAWEIVVNPEVKMNLKIGVEDRYDSNPGGKKRNDFDYFAVLGWAF